MLAFTLLSQSACQNKQDESAQKQNTDESAYVDSIHAERTKKIIQWMASNLPFSRGITRDVGRIDPTGTNYFYYFYYLSKRIVNGVVFDTVAIEYHIKKSINRLGFDEVYSIRNDTMANYYYNIEDGKMTCAYVYKGKPKYNSEEGILNPGINKYDSTLMVDMLPFKGMNGNVDFKKREETNRKSIPFFMPKLLKSIDELYDILFK